MIIYDSAQGRRSAILQILKDDSSVNVTELSKRFGVSEVTIRKDLRILKERKLLVRVHGGAIMGASSMNDEVEERHVNFKKLVAKRRPSAAPPPPISRTATPSWSIPAPRRRK